MTRLLVCSTGGHLNELHLLAARLDPPSDDELWVTFDAPQSRRLLAGLRVYHVRDTPPRDWRSVLVNTGSAARLLRGVDSVISTGAGIALSFLPLARAHGIDTHYIESAARVSGPSLTGRILERVPGMHLYTQQPSLAGSRWNYRGSVFDDFEAAAVPVARPLRSIFVTVGTLDFPFTTLLTRLREIIPRGVTVTVQAGPAAAELRWPGVDMVTSMTPDAMAEAMRRADIVVAHAGIGSVLTSLAAGRVPVLVPRRVARAEHVDDHQQQIAQQLTGRGLAAAAEAPQLRLEQLTATLSLEARRTPHSPSFVL